MDILKNQVDLIFKRFGLLENEKEEKEKLFKNPLSFTPSKEQIDWVKKAFEISQDVPNEIVLILGARKYGKTESCIYMITKLLFKNPYLTFILMTKKPSRGNWISKRIASALLKSGINLSTQKEGFFDIQKEEKISSFPSFQVISVDSENLKGNHVDYILLDDALLASDGRSVLKMQKVEELIKEATNAAKRVIVIGQFVNIYDPYVKLRNQKGVLTLEKWHGSFPFLDTNLEKKRALGMSEKEIGFNYLGILNSDDENPFSEIFSCDMGKPSGDVYAYLDPSAGGGDYTVLSIGWLKGEKDSNYYKLVVAGFSFLGSFSKFREKITSLCKSYQVNYFFYEKNGIGEGIKDILLLTGFQIPIFPVFHHQNKNDRIVKLSYYYNLPFRPVVFDIHTDKNYLTMLRMFHFENKNIHDDVPDSLAGLLECMKIIID